LKSGKEQLTKATNRAAPEVEAAGIDETEHAETAYEFSTLTGAGHSTTPTGHPATSSPTSTKGERTSL
jgi:hypothetical protein